MLHAVLTWFSYMFNPHEKTSSEVRKGRDIQLTILRSDIGTKTPAEGKKSKTFLFFFIIIIIIICYSVWLQLFAIPDRKDPVMVGLRNMELRVHFASDNIRCFSIKTLLSRSSWT